MASLTSARSLRSSLSYTTSVASLFAAGEIGVWFDSTDITTLFQDSAGTTPVTAAGQPIGLMLDKSKGLVLGVNISTTNIRAFITGGGAPDNTLINNGDGTYTVANGSTLRFVYGLTANLTNKTVFIKADYVSGATSNTLLDWTDDIRSMNTQNCVAGNSYIFYGVHSATTGEGSFVDITNTSGTPMRWRVPVVQELPGFHATQSTVAQRPTYGVIPYGGVRNFANGSGAVGDVTYWPAGATVNGVTHTKLASGVDTDGLPYVDISVVGTASATAFFDVYAFSNSRVAAAVGQTLTTSVLVKMISGTAPPAGCGAVVGAVGETAPSTFIETFVSTQFAPTVETLASLSVTLANAASNQARVNSYIRTGAGATVNYTLRIKGLQFEKAAARSAFQLNLSKYNVTEAGKASLGVLYPDGVDDGMVTPAINFQNYTWDGLALRNLVSGGAQTKNYFTYPNGILQNGVTSTNVGGGVDPDGIPYALIRYQGTSTGPQHGTGITQANMKVAAVAGQTFTSSMTAALVGGSAANLVGLRIDVAEENSSGIYLTNSSSTLSVAAIDTPHVVTRTLTEATTAFARAGVVLTFTTGAAIDATFKIKGLQFESGAVKTAWQGTGTDKMTVWAGLQKMSDAPRGMLAELGSGGFNGFALNVPNPTNAYTFVSAGSAQSQASAPITSYPAPNAAVITGIGDISGDISTLMVNNVVATTSAADQGTGNYSNNPIYLFRRGGTSLPYNGIFTGLIVRGAASSAAQISLGNGALNAKLGAY